SPSKPSTRGQTKITDPTPEVSVLRGEAQFASVRLFSAAAESPNLHAGLVWRVDLAQPDHPSSLGQPDAP
ncbi:MAG TPA: hypothetical protein VF788_17325, partial [Pseudonocardiaceae bacterium]